MQVASTDKSHTSAIGNYSDVDEVIFTSTPSILDETLVCTDNNTTNKDLFDLLYYNSLNENEKIEHKTKIFNEFGFSKGLAFEIATRFGDINMQQVIYDKLSILSANEIFSLTSDFDMSIRCYVSGLELKAGYSLTLDEINYLNRDFDMENLNSFYLNLNAKEFEYIFATLYESHHNLSKVVGKNQTLLYTDVYKSILNSFQKLIEKF